MNPGLACNWLLAQQQQIPALQYAQYALMATGGVLLLAVGIGAVRNHRPLVGGPDRRTHIPFEAVLIPPLVFFFVSSLTMVGVSAPGVGTRHTGGADAGRPVVATDPGQTVLITTTAMLAGALAAYVVLRRYLGGETGGVFWIRGQAAGQMADGVAAALIALALCYGLLWVTIWIVQSFDPGFAPVEHQTLEAMHEANRPGWLMPVIWIGTCVVTPIGEELFFRGLIQTTALRITRRRWAAIAISAAVFGLAHARQPHVIASIALFGVILGILYERRAALAGPVIAHALFNARTILWQVLAQS